MERCKDKGPKKSWCVGSGEHRIDVTVGVASSAGVSCQLTCDACGRTMRARAYTPRGGGGSQSDATIPRHRPHQPKT